MSSPALPPSLDAPSTAGAAGVAVVLVSHDGARWLPGVLDGLAAQAAPAAQESAVAAVACVDTGSVDESASLLEARYPEVVRAPDGTGFAEAVRLGLERLDLVADRQEWVWLLHDDARPADDALARLLAAAADRPDVDVLGPKLREWPSLRRLLELGVTISGTGGRETGLEPGEYDQGQHDRRREVLAVNTAGMLVRRDVLERLGGFDDELPVLGTDLDFGWRAAAAGHTTLVVPDAVVFHAEAARRGLRPAAPRRERGVRAHRHFQARRGALFTLLANSRGAALPLQATRLVLGTVLRVLGFLLVRSPGEALDEAAALASVLAHPGRLRAARRRRRALRVAPPDRVRELLAPRWTPYRHGLDLVGDLVTAATHQAADVAERRRAAAAESGASRGAATGRRSRVAPTDDPDLDGLTDTGVVARYLTSPVALVLTLVVAVVLVGARAALGPVSGGALSPAPSSAGTWWGLYLDSWHALGAGTGVPGPPYLPVLAVLGSVVGTTATVALLLLLAAPLALWGGYRLLRVLGHLVSPEGMPRWVLVGGAATWAVVPFTSGAWGEGRLGLVVAAAVLPWLALAATGFADPGAERRRRAGWRVGLLTTLLAAFAPVGWLVVVVVVVVAGLAAVLVTRSLAAPRSVWGPPVVALATPLVLLAPWWVTALVRGAGPALLLDTGRPPSAGLTPVDLAAGRIGDLGAPVWAGLVLVALAVLALVPRTTRVPVLVCWLVVTTTVVTTALLSLPTLDLAALSTPVGLGVPVLVTHAGLVVAVALGAQGVAASLAAPAPAGAGRRPRRRIAGAGALVLAAGALVVPATGLVWSVVGDDDFDTEATTEVPAYMVQGASRDPERGVLVVRGEVETGLTYVVRRGEGVTLGSDEVLALDPSDATLDAVVTELLARPDGGTADDLGALGIEYVLLPAPADGSVAASLDATNGLAQSGADPGTRAWQVDRVIDTDALAGPSAPWRAVLLVVALLGLLVVVVGALPTLPGRSAREGER